MDTQPANFDDLHDKSFAEDAAGYETLGPNYFYGRAVAERFMAAFEAEHFKPLIDKCCKEIGNQLWESVSDHLISDTESNLQGAIWRRVDYAVKALLTGQKWALDQYVMAEKHDDGEKIRKAVAAHIPQEVMSGRIADLEKEVEHLNEQVRWMRR